MTKCLWGCMAFAILGLVAAPTGAEAQFPPLQQNNPFYRPPISPYLNLARGGSAAINYYGLVRPQIDFQRQLQYMQTQQLYLPQFGVVAEEDGTMGTSSITGHPSMFFNYSHYFGQNTMGGQQTQQQALPILRQGRFGGGR